MRDRMTLCFFVDALGWELFRKHPCFQDVTPHAYRQRTVLGYSCAAQPTILTGEMPSTHGHWGMFYRTEHSQLASLRHMRLLPPALSSGPCARGARMIYLPGRPMRRAVHENCQSAACHRLLLCRGVR